MRNSKKRTELVQLNGILVFVCTSIDERLTFDATSETTPIVLGLSFAIIIVLIFNAKKKFFAFSAV